MVFPGRVLPDSESEEVKANLPFMLIQGVGPALFCWVLALAPICCNHSAMSCWFPLFNATATFEREMKSLN